MMKIRHPFSNIFYLWFCIIFALPWMHETIHVFLTYLCGGTVSEMTMIYIRYGVCNKVCLLVNNVFDYVSVMIFLFCASLYTILVLPWVLSKYPEIICKNICLRRKRV